MSKGLPRSLARGSQQRQHVTKITLPVSTTVTVSATGTAVGFGTVVLGGLPEGFLKLMAAACSLVFSGSGADANLSDTWNGDFSIGTSPTADVTLSGTEVNLIASTSIGPAVGELAPAVTTALGTDALLDNTDGSLEVNLNVLIDAADIVDDSSVDLTVQGVFEVTLVTLLDK